MSHIQPTFFISHGGGPWPWMEYRPGIDKLARFLQELPATLVQKPKALLVISGHWEEANFSVMTSEHPPMVYDYYGFPEHTYQIKYPAPGEPRLAEQVAKLLEGRGIKVLRNSAQGFDHGAFTTAYPMYPEADVPLIQLSLKNGYSPKDHFEVGRALRELRSENVVIIGSGLSYHNLRFPPEAYEHSLAFEGWLENALVHMSGEQRMEQIENWVQAPFARLVHPREDHFAPLFVALGAAEDEVSQRVFNEVLFNRIVASSYRFG